MTDRWPKPEADACPLIIVLMRISELGEFGLIELLTKEFGIPFPPRAGGIPRPGLLVDLGDDAVVSQSRDRAIIWTTDTLVDGVHFLAGRTSWRDIGWKALAVNLSDIAAMGGSPNLFLVTLALPADFGVEDAVELYHGLHDAALAYDVTLGGGDIVSSPVFSLTVAACGWAESSNLGQPKVMRRAAALVGDIVAVSGNLGDSAGGLNLLQEGGTFSTEAEVSLRRAHEHPRPRVALGMNAVRNGVLCGIDISDGLVQDLGHIAAASGAGIRLNAARLPLSGALREVFPSQALGLALSGGEDYELILIGAKVAIESLVSEEAKITEIGQIVHQDGPGVVVVDDSGREIPIATGGWNHFPSL